MSGVTTRWMWINEAYVGEAFSCLSGSNSPWTTTFLTGDKSPAWHCCKLLITILLIWTLILIWCKKKKIAQLSKAVIRVSHNEHGQKQSLSLSSHVPVIKQNCALRQILQIRLEMGQNNFKTGEREMAQPLQVLDFNLLPPCFAVFWKKYRIISSSSIFGTWLCTWLWSMFYAFSMDWGMCREGAWKKTCICLAPISTSKCY